MLMQLPHSAELSTILRFISFNMLTRVYQIEGRCFSACVASIFSLPLFLVPYFVLEDDWVGAVNRWLKQYKLFYLEMLVTDSKILENFGYHIICGLAERSGVQHAVVGYKGECIHDPFPSGNGKLFGEITYGLFVPLNPLECNNCSSIRNTVDNASIVLP